MTLPAPRLPFSLCATKGCHRVFSRNLWSRAKGLPLVFDRRIERRISAYKLTTLARPAFSFRPVLKRQRNQRRTFIAGRDIVRSCHRDTFSVHTSCVMQKTRRASYLKGANGQPPQPLMRVLVSYWNGAGFHKPDRTDTWITNRDAGSFFANTCCTDRTSTSSFGCKDPCFFGSAQLSSVSDGLNVLSNARTMSAVNSRCVRCSRAQVSTSRSSAASMMSRCSLSASRFCP